MKKFRGIFLKDEQEIALIRQANRIVAIILDRLASAIRPGMRTITLENIALKGCEEYEVRPAFKGYMGYPYALCCSVNEQVVHGFPGDTILREGDIVSLDFGVVYKGFYGDSARTIPVGEIEPATRALVDVTHEALMEGIGSAVADNNLYVISSVIQKYAESRGYGVVKRFVGHGIGKSLHEKPEVPNFVPRGLPGVPLKEGMTLAIEPMLTMGKPEVEVLADKWTAVTRDRSLSAHFEHTIAITANGPEILSRP